MIPKAKSKEPDGPRPKAAKKDQAEAPAKQKAPLAKKVTSIGGTGTIKVTG